MAQYVVECLTRVVDQDRLVPEALYLLHQRLQLRERNADQLNIEARPARPSILRISVAAVHHAAHRWRRGEDFGERRHVLRAHLQLGTPFTPALDHAVNEFVKYLAADAEPGRARQQGRQQAPARFLIDHAQVRERAGEAQRMRQRLHARAVGEAGGIGILVVESGLDQHVGQAPFVEQGGSELVVVHGEALLLERGHFAALVAALDQDAGVLVGIEGGQGKLADAREQADGEQFLAGNLREVREFLAGDAGRQRMRPETLVVELSTCAATVAVHDRQPDDEIAYAEGAERNDRALQRDDRP